MNRHGVIRLFVLVAFVAVAALPVFAQHRIAHATEKHLRTRPSSAMDDASIIKRLRPEQRSYLIVAERGGLTHAIAFVEPFEPAIVAHASAPPHVVAQTVAFAQATFAHAISTFGPSQTLSPMARQVPRMVRPSTPSKASSTLAPTRSIALASTSQPSTGNNVRETVAPRATHLEPQAAPILIAHPDPRSYVPTTATSKPAAKLPPQLQEHDIAWMWSHRFSTPPPDEAEIPGVPVRSQVASPFDIESGAFHGVRSVNGWSALRVVVSIPCGISHFVLGQGFNGTGSIGLVDQETGYVYIGGWGAGPQGVAVDAGLQKSSAQSTNDDYAFYFKYASNKPITSEMRFPCGGPDVVLELYAVTDSMLVFSATGVNASHNRVTLTLVQKTRPEDGWVPSGGSIKDGIILKRIVAIAQPSTWHRRMQTARRDRFVDGSYFGVKGPRDHTPRIVFQKCEIGRVTPPAIVPSYRAWRAAETWSPSAPSIYLDWPPLGIFRSVEGVCDAAGIYLHAL